MTLAEARNLLPPEDRNMSDQDLSALLADLYDFSDLTIDIFFEREGYDRK